MSPELLSSSTRHPSSDIFSFGLTLYEIASELHIDMPSEGPQWHQLRSNNEPRLPFSRGKELEVLVQSMTNPKHSSRPTADQILENANIKAAGRGTDVFLRDYLQDVQAHEDKEAELRALEFSEEKTPRQDMRYSVRSPSLSMMIPAAPNLLSPAAVGKR
jgi:serine/threonine protein kinase